jgi:hypothetical protein
MVELQHRGRDLIRLSVEFGIRSQPRHACRSYVVSAASSQPIHLAGNWRSAPLM